MIRSRAPLAAILWAVLVASCGGRPSVTVAVGGEVVPMQLVSTTEGTPCSSTHGDAFLAPTAPTIVRAAPPVTMGVDSEPGTSVRVWIYDIDRPTPSGGPLEEFTLTSGGTHRSRSIVAGRTYHVLVNVSRSVLGFRSEVTHAFRVRLEAQ